jgi:chromosome segregation ATPase
MMALDDLRGRSKAFVSEVREVLDWHIDDTQKRVAASKAENATAQATLSTLQDQLKQTQAQLNATNAHLGKASDLVSLKYETAEERKTLEKVRAELAQATTAVAAKAKEVADAERKLIAINNEVTGLTAVRARNEDMIREQRAKFA